MNYRKDYCVLYSKKEKECPIKGGCEKCNFFITAQEYEKKNGITYEEAMQKAKEYGRY